MLPMPTVYIYIYIFFEEKAIDEKVNDYEGF